MFADTVYRFNTLRISSGFGDVGRLQLHLAVGLLLYWFLIFLCVMKGIKSVGKVKQKISLSLLTNVILAY